MGVSWDEWYAHFVTRREQGNTGLRYALQKLCSEAGEALQLLAEAERKGEVLSLPAVALELGDCLWSIQSAATHIGTDLPSIATLNEEKLNRRSKEGKDPVVELALAEKFLAKP